MACASTHLTHIWQSDQAIVRPAHMPRDIAFNAENILDLCKSIQIDSWNKKRDKKTNAATYGKYAIVVYTFMSV
jgi:hypothetical protein